MRKSVVHKLIYMRLLVLATIVTLISCGRPQPSLREFQPSYFESIDVGRLQELEPTIEIDSLEPGLSHVVLTYHVTDTIHQEDWQINFTPAFKASFHWQPHLTPTSRHVVAQHVFRAPAVIAGDDTRQVVLMPDLELLRSDEVKWYMDLDAPNNRMTLGLSKTQVTSHVLFERDKGLTIPPGDLKFGFCVITTRAREDIRDPWRRPLAFMWKKYAAPLYAAGQPIKGSLEPYVQHAYKWAFDTWSESVWQEFELGGTKVGAPVFIVNVTQSPNYPGEVNEREFRSVWNQAWFSSLRSASGLYRYARRTHNEDLMRRANMTKELALRFPQNNGLFPSVIGTEMEMKKIGDKDYKRSRGWDHRYFGNSNRNPVNDWGAASEAPYHILDMSWTATLMLEWNRELEQDPRLVAYAKRYADRLVTLQDAKGFFPGWLDQKSFQPLAIMNETPESSMSAIFLTEMFNVTRDSLYLKSATKALNAVLREVTPVSRWEDFETYWSCSRVLDSLVGKKIVRNDAYKQNTLSMFWTADACFRLYKISGNKHYLDEGQAVLDEMLMFQQTWQPPYIPIPVLGGFGVMNGDGEWNDSRQCLFAELIVQYGKELKNEEYVQRGLAALRSAFVMMYCPENPETKTQWEKVYPFFNEKDYGFMMENYGHGGASNAEGLGIGEFTIYDWGNGAAAESYNKMLDHELIAQK